MYVVNHANQLLQLDYGSWATMLQLVDCGFGVTTMLQLADCGFGVTATLQLDRGFRATKMHLDRGFRLTMLQLDSSATFATSQMLALTLVLSGWKIP